MSALFQKVLFGQCYKFQKKKKQQFWYHHSIKQQLKCLQFLMIIEVFLRYVQTNSAQISYILVKFQLRYNHPFNRFTQDRIGGHQISQGQSAGNSSRVRSQKECQQQELVIIISICRISCFDQKCRSCMCFSWAPDHN